MPIPKPNTNESKDDFITRCMGDEVMTEEYEPDQRRAICESQWTEAKNMSGFHIKAKGEDAEILIYEDIGEGWLGGISAKRFADEIKTLGKVKNISLKINSYGGSVFDGIAIYNTLRNHQARVTTQIDGIAASIASIIAMAGEEISIAENGFMMIHDPWTLAAGNASELREQADLLDKIRDTLVDTYMKKATVSEEEISKMMADETWLTAQEALDVGLVTHIADEVKLAACANIELMKKFKHIPQNLTSEETPRLEKIKVISAKMEQALRRRKL